MQVASLENCKRLYELSGWDDTSEWHVEFDAEPLVFHKKYPAYDLGYLLRKLPVWIDPKEYGPLEITKFVGDKWEMRYKHRTQTHTLVGVAHNPEDAAAELCIQLIEQGVIKDAK